MKLNFRMFATIASLFVLFMLAACGGSNDTASDASGESGAVSGKIGVVSFMTGSGAAYGEAITNGLELAEKELDEAGEVDVELVIEDSAGEPDQALSVTQKLINSEDVVGIIGPTLSTEMEVVGPVADQNGVPIMGTSNTAEGIPQIGEYVFRDSIPETQAIPASVEKAIEEYDAKKVAIMYGNDDVFTKAGYDAMKDAAEDLGLEELTTQTFQIGQSDYKAQLSKIKQMEPDLILCSALYNEGAVIMKQARSMGIDVPFVGGNGFNSPEVIEIAGDAADGLIVATPWFTKKDDQKVQDFVSTYKDEFGKEPDQFAAQAYDGLYLMAEGLKNAGEADRDELRDAIAEIDGFEGVLGDISFDEDGDVVMDPTVLIIEDGEFKEMK
ncbi:branched-chain amino acid transport system substrate-binding protein [Virgibacillus halotolerans]|uniref:ABC transporter substrate-binding protein n=1 Tax=Virgibacillus halotolerans TaxID=1071053 RepID=UPI001960C8D4|nr:ABC transporter substrate-binding protein [Virgibacillus halotolerans]MBM7598964.1 branched-chain amino acid transport system substrate-binding protein [Virgibacillus halotolerans]